MPTPRPNSTLATHDTTVQAQINSVMWDELSGRVDAFCVAWEENPPPDLNNFIPIEKSLLRRFVLIELIKVDLEYRWLQHDMPKQIEEYAQEFPELLQAGCYPTELIYEEYHVRSQSSAPPPVQEFYDRFPDHRETMQRLLGVQTNMTVSTVMSGRKKVPVYEPGDKIDDFDLLLKLGKGAFASVYLARQRSMQRIVALKISRDKGTEPQTLAQLDHPHIVRVYDQRVLPDNKIRLMYMQHVPGGTLQGVVATLRRTLPAMRKGQLLLDVIDEELKKNGQDPSEESSFRKRLSHLSWPQVVCWLGARLSWALDYAHQRGVLHRDIKPANVLLAADGSPKLADFNVSFSSKVEGVSAASFFGGSLAYMSPEQLEATDPQSPREASELDGRSDLYSLALMLWEMLSGFRPFPEDISQDKPHSMLQQFREIRRQGIPEEAFNDLPADMPPGLREILLECLSDDPAKRPAKAADLARRLELCLKPQAQRLFLPAAGSWIQTMRNHPLWFFILVGLVPNVVLSFVNIVFNLDSVIKHLLGPAESVNKVLLPINIFAYPIGVIVGFMLGLPIVKAVRKFGGTNKVKISTNDEPHLSNIRGKCLWLGSWIALITFMLWIFSGVAIPWLVSRGLPNNVEFSWPEQVLLFSSQVLFGSITATQVFYWMTYLNLHVYYPVLTTPNNSETLNLERLTRLERVTSYMFWIALATPFAAIFIMLQQILAKNRTQGLQHNSPDLSFIFGLITAVGFLASVVAYFLQRRIQADIATLGNVLGASEQSSTWMGESAESFWTQSR